MEIEKTELTVTDERAKHDRGTVVKLEIDVQVRNEYKVTTASISTFTAVFERRGQTGPLHWTEVVDADDSNWFNTTHCAVVQKAASYVEEYYREQVDTKQIRSVTGEGL